MRLTRTARTILSHFAFPLALWAFFMAVALCARADRVLRVWEAYQPLYVRVDGNSPADIVDLTARGEVMSWEVDYFHASPCGMELRLIGPDGQEEFWSFPKAYGGPARIFGRTEQGPGTYKIVASAPDREGCAGAYITGLRFRMSEVSQ